jgi:hypothetical protein
LYALIPHRIASFPEISLSAEIYSSTYLHDGSSGLVSASLLWVEKLAFSAAHEFMDDLGPLKANGFD